LNHLSASLDRREFEKASALGYGAVTAEFIFLQRTLGGLQGASRASFVSPPRNAKVDQVCEAAFAIRHPVVRAARRFERSGLELDDDVALQACVVEEQVDKELVAADFDALLTTYEGEAGAKLEEEASDVPDQRVFDIVLMCLVADTQEVEMVRVFERFCRELRLCGAFL
jgi:hypothetical protein